jgi:hypothetical protein
MTNIYVVVCCVPPDYLGDGSCVSPPSSRVSEYDDRGLVSLEIFRFVTQIQL